MFVKKDGTKLETVKLVAKNLNDTERVMRIGILIESLFYRPTIFQQRSIEVIQCFKCQRFGQVSKNCKSTPRRGHCSGNHNFKSCDKKDSPTNCANCNSNHEADSTECPSCLKCISKLYSSRGTTLPNRIKKLMNRLHIGNDWW